MYSRLRRPAVALIATTLAASVLGIAPANAVVPGSIAGTVTTDAAPVDGLLATAWLPDGEDWSYVGEDFTDETGAYLIEDLSPSDDYLVAFESPDGTYVYEVYDDAADFQDANVVPVPVGDGESVLGIDADVALAGQITGTVTDEVGVPLLEAYVGVYAEVSLPGGGTDWEYVSGDDTDELGAYEVEGMPAGSYRVDFSRDGYQSEYYDDVPTLEGSEPVVVVGGVPTPGIDAALAEDATISGTVTGSGGQPLEGAYVGLIVGDDFADFTITDADGDYTLDGLRDGTYVVSFDYEDAVTEEYLYEYYDNAGEFEDADPVTVEAGEDVSFIDAQLIAGEHEPVSLDNVTAPMISGTPQVGSALTVTTGTWSASPQFYEYYWYAGDDYVQGSASATYVPTATDIGKAISVVVIAIATGYDDGFIVAGPTAPVVAAPVVVVSPVVTPPVVAPPVDVASGLAAIVAGLDVTGKPKVGKTVKVAGLDVALRTAVTYKFQWYAGTKKIKKATKSKLKVLSSMRGKKLSVKVTATASTTSKTVKLKVGKVR